MVMAASERLVCVISSHLISWTNLCPDIMSVGVERVFELANFKTIHWKSSWARWNLHTWTLPMENEAEEVCEFANWNNWATKMKEFSSYQNWKLYMANEVERGFKLANK